MKPRSSVVLGVQVACALMAINCGDENKAALPVASGVGADSGTDVGGGDAPAGAPAGGIAAGSGEDGPAVGPVDGVNAEEGAPTSVNPPDGNAAIDPSSADPTLPAPVATLGPPMGFNHYNSFGGSANETLIRQIADAMVTNGMRDAGYLYVNLDEGWQAGRDAQGNILPNTTFPSGIQSLADYVHSRGLKFGIYTTPTAVTCGNRMGSLGYEQQDLEAYAAWGVDYVKLDWCGSDYSETGAAAIARAWRDGIVATGRPMLLSINAGANPSVAPWASTIVTMWRTGDDICASWYNKTRAHDPATRDCYNTMYHNGIFDYLYANLEPNAPFSAPGHWGDPDMLEVGNAGLSFEESKTHFSMWAMWSAPLIAGNDPRTMNGTDIASRVLLNREVIALDQDPRGAMATKIQENGGLQVWRKVLAREDTQGAALVNATDGAATITLNWSDLGWTSVTAIRDLWEHADITPVGSSFTATVPPHGTVLLTLTGS